MDKKELRKPIALLFVFFLVVLFFAGYFIETRIDENVVKSLHHGVVAGEYFLSALELAAVIYAIYNRKAIRVWIAKHLYRQVKFEKTGELFKDKVEGVIIPVSRTEQPEWIIRHLKPEYVGFLYTDWSKKSALKLIADLKGLCKFIPNEEEIRNSENVIKPDDPAAAKKIAGKYIKRLLAEGILKKNIYVDTTGGRVPMSIGVFQAAEEAGISSIYIVGKGNDRGEIVDPKNKEHGSPIFLSDNTEMES